MSFQSFFSSFSDMFSRLFITACLPTHLSHHTAAAQHAPPPAAADFSGRSPLAPAFDFPAASAGLRTLTQPDATQHQQRVGDGARHAAPEKAQTQPHYFHRAAADGPGEEVPEAEVPLHT